MLKRTIILPLICFCSLSSGQGQAEEAHEHKNTLDVSPEVLELLRSEMREIAGGMQAMTYFISTADWQSIQETSAKIHASYIMEAKLTPEQSKELEALPEGFKTLDAGFHHRAEKLGEAARAHDAELVTYHYARMLESCVVCHAQYAKTRFPAFSSGAEPAHHH